MVVEQQMVQGTLQKMRVEFADPVRYFVRIGREEVPLSSLLGHEVQLAFQGHIYCIQCGRKTAKSFQGGYCFPCMRRLMECGMCIIHPERCKVEEGHCSPDDWAHSHCNAAQIVYLAHSSGLKVGITRKTQIPTRWIDQGAMAGLMIYETSNRYQAGLMEVALKKYVKDKTNWRAMLNGQGELLDLKQEWQRLSQEAHADLEQVIAKFPEGSISPIADSEIMHFTYPTQGAPQVLKTISLDKTPTWRGRLQGVKGQYWIFDNGVINIRNWSGYEVQLTIHVA